MTLEKFTLSLLAFLAMVAILILGKSIIVPIVVSFLIWMLIDSLAVKIKSIKLLGRQLPKWAISFSALIVFSTMMLLVYKVLVTQTNNLMTAAPFYQQKGELIIGKLSSYTGLKISDVINDLYSSLDFTELLSVVADSTQTMLSSVFLIFIYVGFMFVEQGNAKSKIDALKKSSAKFTLIQSIFKNSITLIKRYIRLKSTVSALTSLSCYFVLAMFEVDFAELWAITTFLLNFIPNIGSALAVVFPSLLACLQFDSVPYIAMIIASLVVIQFVIGNIIEPSIMGKSLNLSAFMILISLSFWGLVWGVAGMFLAIPLMVATAIVFSNIEEMKWAAILMSANGKILSEQ